MKDDWLKWIYTFVLLGATLGWGMFCVETVKWALINRSDADIIGTAGVGIILGLLLAMAKDVNQFWFRKSKAEKPTSNMMTSS
jgi:hypothetical protein